MSSPHETVSLAWPQLDIALATMVREREMNTLSLELLDELGAALEASVSGGARALIVTGQGRAFCAGAHLRYFTQPDPRIGEGGFALRDNYLRRIAELFDRIETLPIPVIAAINGFALGGGCELSLACDLRVMADNTKIGVPETRIGALAGAGGVQKLHRFVGHGKALEWVMLGSHVTAQEALQHGLVTSVHAPADLLAAAMELAVRFRTLGPRAVAQSKAAVRQSQSDVVNKQATVAQSRSSLKQTQANLERDAGTCGSTARAASTISAPPLTPALKRQRKNQKNETGYAQAKNDAVASSISMRKTTLTGAIAVIHRAPSAPTR